MWKCPVCGREFGRVNQSHYCSDRPGTIDEYIAMQNPEQQPDLMLMRSVLRQALPEAEERISWRMPTWWKERNIVHFAAAKNHIGFYIGAEAAEKFADELRKYKTDKGTVRIPYGQVDAELIGRIARRCLQTDCHA